MEFALETPIVLAASAPWASPFPVNAHHLARRFAGRGHRVLYVESTGLRAPAATASDARRIARRLGDWWGGVREVEPRLAVLSPLALPGAGSREARSRSLRWLASQVQRAARRLELGEPVLWAFVPTALELAERLAPALVVYHCVDHYAANPGVDRSWLDALERRMLARADLVIASSVTLAERLRLQREDVVLAENVAEVAPFVRAAEEPLAEPAELTALPHPRALWAGNLASYRIDYALLDAVARLPASLVLLGEWGHGDVAGRSEARSTLLRRPNVAALGPRPHQALPPYFRHCDVGLIPFLDNEHTRGSFPLKLWEYLAAGLPVVATDLPNLRPLAARGLVRVAASPAAFAAALRECVAEPKERRKERVAIAAQHGWDARIEELAALAGRALAGRRQVSQRGVARPGAKPHAAPPSPT